MRNEIRGDRVNRVNGDDKDDWDDWDLRTIKMVTDKFPNGLIDLRTIRRGYHSPIFPIFLINSTSISEINLLSEGCRVLHSAKMPPMGSTRCTSHWWHFLLGAAIDPLSRKIICC